MNTTLSQKTLWSSLTKFHLTFSNIRPGGILSINGMWSSLIKLVVYEREVIVIYEKRPLGLLFGRT